MAYILGCDSPSPFQGQTAKYKAKQKGQNDFKAKKMIPGPGEFTRSDEIPLIHTSERDVRQFASQGINSTLAPATNTNGDTAAISTVIFNVFLQSISFSSLWSLLAQGWFGTRAALLPFMCAIYVDFTDF